MPGGDGATLTREIGRCSLETRVLAYSVYRGHTVVMGMLEAGEAGYIIKGGPSEEILESIMTVASGRSARSSGAFAGVVEELSNTEVSLAASGLSTGSNTSASEEPAKKREFTRSLSSRSAHLRRLR